MYTEFENIIAAIDRDFDGGDAVRIPHRLSSVPLEVFGQILVDRPKQFERLMNWLPPLPSDEIQRNWTGAEGHLLMEHSVSFIRSLVNGYHSLTLKSLAEAQVLDFGCGWGRFIRLLYKYAPATQIYGVDAWGDAIDLCRPLHGNFYVSDRIPTKLPTPAGTKFDLIFAFSVFTHLSERVMSACLETLIDYLSDTGVLVITIRPVEYWMMPREAPDSEIPRLLKAHQTTGFAFWPHGWTPIDGDIPYGDASMSLRYIRERFPRLRIASVEWSKVDAAQIVVFLQKA